MSLARSKHLPHVDGLRAVAVLAVLLFHLGVVGCGGGFVGVDVFLVISGYLITRLIVDELAATGGFRFGAFYVRRVRRLAPALLVASLATFAFCVAAFSPGMLARTGRELVAATASVSNVHFWLAADYFDVAAASRPLLHTWSLSLEEQFYLLWPGLLFLAFRAGGARRLAWILPLVGVISLAASVASAEGAPAPLLRWLPDAAADGKTTIFYLLPFRVFEFTVGGWLALAPAATAVGWRLETAFAAGVAAIAASVLVYDDAMLFPSTAALLPCAGAAAAIRWGGTARLAAWLRSGAVVHVGRISYSLYLWHWPVVVLATYLCGPLDPAGKLGVAAASLALGHLSWRFVETPFRERRLPLWPVAVAAGIAVVAGRAAAVSGGWPQRVGAAIAVADAGDAEEHHRREYGGAGYRNGLVGDAEPPAFLLVGDSHGKQLAEGLVREVAEPNGLGVWIKAGASCLHLPGFVRRTAGVDWSARLRLELDQLRALLAAGERQPVVVLGQAWITQAARSALVDASGAVAPRAITPEDVVDGIVRLRAELGIRRLVVVGQTPAPPVADLFEELTRPAWSRRFDVADVRAFACGEQARLWNEVLRAGAERSGAYEFLDPVAALTEDGRCLAIEADGRLVYSDDSHLSKAGSRRVARAFAGRLAALAASR